MAAHEGFYADIAGTSCCSVLRLTRTLLWTGGSGRDEHLQWVQSRSPPKQSMKCWPSLLWPNLCTWSELRFSTVNFLEVTIKITSWRFVNFEGWLVGRSGSKQNCSKCCLNIPSRFGCDQKWTVSVQPFPLRAVRKWFYDIILVAALTPSSVNFPCTCVD